MLSDTINFVLQLVKDSGGFGSTPHLPATVEDTYYALSIISSISTCKNAISKRDYNKTRKYILTCSPSESWALKTLYHYLKASQMMRILSQVKRKVISIFERKRKDWVSPEDIYYFYLLRQELGESLDAPLVGSKEWEGLSWRTVSELWMKLAIVFPRNKPRGEIIKRIVEWVQNTQNPDGGFGFYPGSTSFIENCHICLNILKYLNDAPLDIAGVEDFIWRCKAARGGFARKNGGAPFLDATWHAVSSLNLIKSM